jgi:hypothetical protein
METARGTPPGGLLTGCDPTSTSGLLFEAGFEEIAIPKAVLPTKHPELPHVTVPRSISHFNFVLVQQPRDFFIAFFLRQLITAAAIGATNGAIGVLVQ